MQSRQISEDDGEAAGGLASEKAHASNWTPIMEQPVYTARKLKIVCVGAGFAGLTLAYKIKHEMKAESFLDLTIYEKNHDVGGTWYENNYPGVACDVPAHIYTFPWAPNPEYSTFYASGKEIWNYATTRVVSRIPSRPYPLTLSKTQANKGPQFKRTTEEYHLDENVQFDTKVLDSCWDERIKKWKIKIIQNKTVHDVEADVFINASGILNQWSWPAIKGLDLFEGKLLHSANWDSRCDWTGKKVAVIGNGSSGIQIVPQIQKKASRIVNYAREPTWISTSFGAEHTPEGTNFTYTEAQKQEFREKPETLHKLRKDIEHGMNAFFHAIIEGSPQQEGLEKHIKQNMETRLNNDPALITKIIPRYKAGCRRLTPGDGYLEAIQAANAHITYSPITEITATGIHTADGFQSFDLIICATGFQPGIFPPFQVRGLNGFILGADRKTKAPEAYFGMCTPQLHNYFSFTGPNSPVGNGSFAPVLSWTADYILKWCEKIAREDIASVVVKQRPVDDFNVYAQEFLKRTVWSGSCNGWYKNGGARDGRVIALYPGSTCHFGAMIENIRGEDFDITYNSHNMFRFMGNGLTVRDEKFDDLAFHLDKYAPVAQK